MSWTPVEAPVQPWQRPADDGTLWGKVDPNAAVTLWDTLLGGTRWDTPGRTLWDLKLAATDDWTKQ